MSGAEDVSTRVTTFRVNGRTFELPLEPRRSLADVLREDCGLTGTRVGCEHGACGTCTVLADGVPIRSCLTFGVQCEGWEIETVESLGTDAQPNPLQCAFIERGAFQCGFCTSGFLMLGTALHRTFPRPTAADVREAIASNICRCTGYHPIIDAICETMPDPTALDPAIGGPHEDVE